MRLTLRTLLAYVDDTLPPDQAREIGQKVAESHVAQELMERIKKVTRRRGLTVPPAAGPERIDANTVAEYLDNDLPADRVAEVEELALNSDVHLAEIAACHQILTLVLGEPAHVPPTARERMYGLVQGKESEPHRRASRTGPPAFPGDAETAEELAAARRGVGYRLLGACVIGIALAIAIWKALPHNPPAPTPPPEPIADRGTQPEPKAEPPAQPPMPEPKPPEANPMPPAKPEPQPMPVEPKPMPEPKPPEPKPAPPPAPAVAKPDRSPSVERKDAGVFASKDAVLLARNGDAWTKITPDTKVATAAPVLALPSSHAELKLDSGARLALWGGLPDTTGSAILDCQVTLHVPPAGFDLDFTLDHGRVYIGTAKAMGPTKVRVRFVDQVWDVTLADEQSEVMVEAVRLFAGEPFVRDGKTESPKTNVTLVVIQGKASVTVDSKEFALQAPPGPAELRWPETGKPIEVDTAPAAWGKTLTKSLPRDRQQDIEAAQKKLVQRVGEKNKSIELAVAEVAQDEPGKPPSRAARVLATVCRGTLGQLTPVLDDVTELQFPDVRQAAAAALAAFAARQPGNDQKLYGELKKAYGDRADQAMWLLHGFSETQLSDPVMYERLIDLLRSDQPAVRELAAWRLRQIDPEGASQIRFNATDPEPVREKAVGDWQRRIPAGKLPPPRANPQGNAARRQRVTG
jgi:hypothetical protein